MSTSANSYVSKGFCPSCRYDLTGLPLGHEITCPECGTATNCIDLPALPPPGWLAKLGYASVDATKLLSKLVVIAIALGLLIGFFWPASSRRGCGRPWSVSANLRHLYVVNDLYAATTPTRRYPKHIASLIPAEFMTPDILEDLRSFNPNGSFSVGNYDLSNYDWSDLETAKLTAAIDSIDTTYGYYRAGDFVFTRLEQQTGDAAIIFAWSMPDKDGTRWVAFDDGHVVELKTSQWTEARKQDRIARYKRSLPVLYPAPP